MSETEAKYVVVVHSKHQSGPKWHAEYARAFSDAFKKFDDVYLQSVTERDSIEGCYGDAIHIIFGPNYFPHAYRAALANNRALTINRCFYGDHTTHVSIGWNGFNGQAQFPKFVPGRLATESDKLPAQQWQQPLHEHVAVIIGEYVSVSDNREEINTFYKFAVEDAKSKGMVPAFRPHPQMKHKIDGAALAPSADITRAQQTYTHSSTYGVHARLIGCPVIADPASLAYSPDGETNTEWLQRVVASQWHISEVASGVFWEHVRNA